MAEEEKTTKCPYCNAIIPDLPNKSAEMAHMDQYHPDIVAERQRKAQQLLDRC